MGCDHSKLESFGRTSQAYYSKFKRFSDDPQACCCKLLKRYGKKLARRWPTTETRSVDAHLDLSDDEQYHNHDHHHDFGDDHGEEYPSHDHRAHSFGAGTNVPKDGGGWYQGGHEHNILRPHTNLDKGKDIMTDDEPPKQPSWHRPYKAEYFSRTCDKSQPNSYYHHSQHEDFVHNPFQKSNPSTYHSQPRDFYHDQSGSKGGISFNAGQNQAYDYNLYPPHHSSSHGTTYNWMCHVPHNDCYCDYYRKPNPHSTYDHQVRNRHHPHGQSAKPQDLSWGEIFGHDPVDQFFAPSFYFN